MTDLVVGGGAVGTLLAWALATGGREVAIVRRRHEGEPRPGRVAVVDLDGRRREAQVTEVRSPADLAASPDALVFSVKMFDLREAVESCSMWPNATALTVSNGIGAEAIVADLRDAGLIAGSVMASVEMGEGGSVSRLNRGGIALAPVRGDVEPLIVALLGAFATAGLRVARFEDAAAMKWSKLVANLVANATSAILDMSAGEVYADTRAFRIDRRQLLEAFGVMRSLHLAPLSLPGADVRLLQLGVRAPGRIAQPIMRRVVAGARGRKEPSLRVHAAAAAGPSEAEWLNGAVAREAERLGRDAPVNRRLAELVGEVMADPDRRAWYRGRPDRLLAAIERPG